MREKTTVDYCPPSTPKFAAVLRILRIPLALAVLGLVCFAWVCQTRSYDRPTIFESARTGDDAAVAQALARGTPVDSREPGSTMTPLMYAAAFNQPHVAKRLLAHGASLGVVCRGSGTALMAAARQGHAEMVKLLLAQGADVDLGNPDGYTPLMAASASEAPASVAALLQAGARVDAVDCMGNTALMIACALGHRESAQRLIEAGADIDLRARDGRDALELAREDGHDDVVLLLECARRDRQSKVVSR